MYNIAVMMKQKTSSIPPTTTFFVRGTVDNEANVIQATRGLIDCLTASFGGNTLLRPAVVSTQMEISPQHHTFIQGKNELLVKQVCAELVWFEGFFPFFQPVCVCVCVCMCVCVCVYIYIYIYQAHVVINISVYSTH